MSVLGARLEAVRRRVLDACVRAGRRGDEVQLLAVSKRVSVEAIQEAHDCGQRDFAENYVQELELKKASLPSDIRWHLIGHVQTNKAKKAVLADFVHTVDSERIASALSGAASAAGKRLPVLVEINLAGEGSKAGVAPAEASALLAAVSALPSLSLVGLMCIPPEGEGRRHFAELRHLRDELRGRTGLALPALSMGMSADFEDAILEGATMVRVGTAIFGDRPEKA